MLQNSPSFFQASLGSKEYCEKLAPQASELFRAAKIRSLQMNPTWRDEAHNNFAYSVLWLMGKSEGVSSNILYNYRRISHMRNAARSSNPLCCTPLMTPIGQWSFDAAVEFVFAHFDKKIP